MKKYLILLVLLAFTGSHQYGFENFFTNEEGVSKDIVLASVIPDIVCDKCDPGKFWNDFMQRCEPIPGWVPKKDSSEYKRDKNHNLLPYGAQDVNKSIDDIAKHNVKPAPIEDDYEEPASEETEGSTPNKENNSTPTPVPDEEPYDPNW